MIAGERAAAWGWSVAAGAAAASLAAAWLPTWIAGAALGITFLVTPGALAARGLLRNGDGLPREAVALAWSPFLSGGAVTLLAALGIGFPLAVRLVVLGIALLAAGRALRPGLRPLAAVGRADLVSALVWSGLVAALLLGVPALALRSDGWFHAAVTHQIAQRGIVPEDPYFAGLRLLYFWGEHAWAASWLVLAPRLAVVAPLLACNIAAAFAVALGVAALTRRLGGGDRAARLAVVLMVAGYAPFAWLQVAARAMWGDVRGWDEISRLVGTGPDATLDLMARGLLHASLVFFGDKYLVVTPFALGLALLTLAALALLECSARPDPRRCAVLGVTLAATLFIHSVIGYCLLLWLGAWWLGSTFEAARGDRAARARIIPLGVTVVLAVACVVPYLYATAAGKQSAAHLGVSMGAVRSAVLGGAVLVPAAFAWLWARRRRVPDNTVLLLGAALLLVLGLVVRLPENNQSKFFNLLWLLVAAPAALAWEDRASRGPRWVAVALVALGVAALLPTVGFSLTAFALEHGQSSSVVRRPTRDERAALDWLRTDSPTDIVLCDLGGARDLLAIAGRTVAWGGPGGERDWGYPPAALALRREAVRALCRAEEPSEAASAWLTSLARPVWVVARASAPDSLAGWVPLTHHPERFRPLFRNADMAFYRWAGSR